MQKKPRLLVFSVAAFDGSYSVADVILDRVPGGNRIGGEGVGVIFVCGITVADLVLESPSF